MSVKASSWAWEQDLKQGPKLVLLALADHADNSGICWPGHESVAEKTGCTTRSVIEHIKILSEADLLTVEERRREGGQRASNRYILHINGKPQGENSSHSDNDAQGENSSHGQGEDSAQNSANSSPCSNKEVESSVESSARQTDNAGEENQTKTPNPEHLGFGQIIDILSPVMGAQTFTRDYTRKTVTEIVGIGVTRDDLEGALAKACQAKPGERFPVSYLVPILRQANMKAVPTKTKPTDWRESASGITAKGEEMGVVQGEGEPFPAFKLRVLDKADGGEG